MVEVFDQTANLDVFKSCRSAFLAHKKAPYTASKDLKSELMILKSLKFTERTLLHDETSV
jgi:hypothetical protein